ncbi:MAG: hypothetical protein KGZ83_18870 [Sulfuricella sp.]|nr:hypothetical protein [Sulfuricella sp.]
MTCKHTLESALLLWLGWISLCIALFGAVISLADPVGLMIPFAALILAGISSVGGNLRFVRIVGGMVVATIIGVSQFAPPTPPTSTITLLGFIAAMFSPAYLIAWGLTVLGRRRARRRLAAISPASAA